MALDGCATETVAERAAAQALHGRAGPAGTIDAAAFLRAHSRTIAAAMGLKPGVSSRLEAQVLRATPSTLTLSVRTGDRQRIVKHFGPDSNAIGPDADAAVRAYRRERDMLAMLAGTGLAPALLAHSDRARMVLVERVDGRTLREALDGAPRAPLCRAVGRWLAAFCAATPSEASSESWAAHLARYPALEGSDVLAQTRGFLDELPVGRTGIARNDGAPSNLLVTPAGRITGIDFKNAARKPHGWDLLLSARALARLLPLEADDITGWLAEGFAENDAPRAARWAVLARIFIAASAFGAPSREIRRHGGTDAYPTHRSHSVTRGPSATVLAHGG